MRFALAFASLLFIAGCAHEIADIELCPLEDPFTGEGYCVSVVTNKERIISREKWIKERRTYVMMSPESYAKIKKQNYKDCYSTECKQLLTNIDGLFMSIDKAVSEALKAGVIR